MFFNSRLNRIIREENTGDNQGTTTTTPPTTTTTPPPVDLDELAKIRKEMADIKAERDSLRDSAKQLEADKLKANNQYKELAELHKKEADEQKLENEKIKKALARREKMSAIRTAAMAAGIRKEALDDLELYDFPEVQIETTSLGNLNIVGAKAAVESLKIKKPYLFGRASGNLNGDLPEVVQGGTVTIDQVMKADDKARKSGSAEDQANYLKLVKQYKSAQKG